MRVSSFLIALSAASTLASPITSLNGTDLELRATTKPATKSSSTTVVIVNSKDSLGRKVNCRGYVATFYTCGAPNTAQPSTFLQPRIEKGINGDTPNPLSNYETLVGHPCMGGDGTQMVYENKAVETWGCAAGEQQYETQVQIWRWRNNWDYCNNINLFMEGYAGTSGLHFWYTYPTGKQVKCKS